MSTPSSKTRSSIRSDTVIGGMRRGSQAAVSTAAAAMQQAIIDLIEIGIQLPTANVTQNGASDDPMVVTRLTT
jgi:hypothetical protein